MSGSDPGERGVKWWSQKAGRVVGAIEELRRIGSLMAEPGLAESTRKLLGIRLNAGLRRVEDDFCREGAEPEAVSLFELTTDALLLASPLLVSDGPGEDGQRPVRSLHFVDDLPRFVLGRGPSLRRLVDELAHEDQGLDWDELILRGSDDRIEIAIAGPRPDWSKAEGESTGGGFWSRRVEQLARDASASLEVRHQPVRTELMLSFRCMPVPNSDALIRPGRIQPIDLGRRSGAEFAGGFLSSRRVLALGLDAERCRLLAEFGAEVDRLEGVDQSLDLESLVTRESDLWIWCSPNEDALKEALKSFSGRTRPILVLGELSDNARDRLLEAGGRFLGAGTGGEALGAEALSAVSRGQAPSPQSLSDNLQPAVSSLMDDPEYGSMIGCYIDAVPGFLNELEEARGEDRLVKIRGVAHRIKGSARLYGFEELSGAGAMCQFAIDDAFPDEERDQTVDQLMRELVRVLVGAHARRPVKQGRL